VTCGTDVRGSGRKGLTGAGRSTVAQTEWRGATVVARRGSRGHRQGGRGSSRCRCGGSERGQSDGPRWLNDGQHGGTVAAEEEERGCSTGGGVVGGAPFIATRGSWQWRRELRPGAAMKLWVWQSGCRYGPKAAGAGKRRCSDRAADEWAQAVSDFFNLSKTGWTSKNQNGYLTLLQKFRIFACSLGGIL
jgi:hypothetical protein